jgi:hypothetical protein
LLQQMFRAYVRWVNSKDQIEQDLTTLCAPWLSNEEYRRAGNTYYFWEYN